MVVPHYIRTSTKKDLNTPHITIKLVIINYGRKRCDRIIYEAAKRTNMTEMEFSELLKQNINILI